MSSTVNLLVRKTVTVNAAQERAFRVFTEGMGTWWPMDSHHTGDQPAVDVVVEPRAGGRWYELAADGSEGQWAGCWSGTLPTGSCWLGTCRCRSSSTPNPTRHRGRGPVHP